VASLQTIKLEPRVQVGTADDVSGSPASGSAQQHRGLSPVA